MSFGNDSNSKPQAWSRLGQLSRITLVLLSLAISSSGYASEEIYSYIDKDETLGIHQYPTGPSEADQRKRINTFSWTDELGVLRRVHRVNVTTYDHVIREAAQYYTLPPELIKAVVAVESSLSRLPSHQPAHKA